MIAHLKFFPRLVMDLVGVPIVSARFYLNFPTGKLFGKLSFLQNFSGGAHSALKHRYIAIQPKEIILELSGSKIF